MKLNARIVPLNEELPIAEDDPIFRLGELSELSEPIGPLTNAEIPQSSLSKSKTSYTNRVRSRSSPFCAPLSPHCGRNTIISCSIVHRTFLRSRKTLFFSLILTSFLTFQIIFLFLDSIFLPDGYVSFKSPWPRTIRECENPESGRSSLTDSRLLVTFFPKRLLL